MWSYRSLKNNIFNVFLVQLNVNATALFCRVLKFLCGSRVAEQRPEENPIASDRLVIEKAYCQIVNITAFDCLAVCQEDLSNSNMI